MHTQLSSPGQNGALATLYLAIVISELQGLSQTVHLLICTSLLFRKIYCLWNTGDSGKQQCFSVSSNVQTQDVGSGTRLSPAPAPCGSSEEPMPFSKDHFDISV